MSCNGPFTQYDPCAPQRSCRKIGIPRFFSGGAGSGQQAAKNQVGSRHWAVGSEDAGGRRRRAVFHCPLPTPCRPLPAACCRLPTAHCPLPAARCPLPTARYLLPAACCLLPTAPWMPADVPVRQFGAQSRLPWYRAGRRQARHLHERRVPGMCPTSVECVTGEYPPRINEFWEVRQEVTSNSRCNG
jgi:hypothetical protein